MQAAALAGTDLGYTSPDQGKPYGPGIEYLMAAAAQHGYQIGPDRACALIKQFNALPWVRAKFSGEGNMSVCADVIKSPLTLWFEVWNEYVAFVEREKGMGHRTASAELDSLMDYVARVVDEELDGLERARPK